MGGAAVGRGVFGAGSGFLVGQRTAGGGLGCYFWEVFCYCWRGFHCCGEAGRWAIILWCSDTFLIFPNFLESKLLNRLASDEATSTDHVYK